MLAFGYILSQEPDDREFFSNLYETYNRIMVATARKYLSKQADIEDIMQDSLVSLMKQTTLLRTMDGCTLIAYIVSTVRNTSINRLKRLSKEKRYSVDIEDASVENMQQDALSPEDLAVLAERKEALVSIWADLPETDRLLLSGKYILGYADQELAKLLDCRKESVRMKLTRARRRALSLLCERGVLDDKT